jgi:hypothetical protein
MPAAETQSAPKSMYDSTAPVASGPVHCPYRRTTDLLQRLSPGKMRIGFFLGAGCPLAVRVSDGTGTKPLIPEISGLTVQIKAALDADEDLKEVAGLAWQRVVGRGISTSTLEDVLSHIRTLKSLCGDGAIDGFTRDQLFKLDYAICERVRDTISIRLPNGDTPYHVLASWIQAIAREKPVEIFTTNYDLYWSRRPMQRDRVAFLAVGGMLMYANRAIQTSIAGDSNHCSPQNGNPRYECDLVELIHAGHQRKSGRIFLNSSSSLVVAFASRVASLPIATKLAPSC